MKNRFKKISSDYEKIMANAEKGILINFKEALTATYELLGDQYRKYEQDGRLTYKEMSKYNRLEVLFNQLDAIVNEGYKNSYKSIRGVLNQTYLTSYNGIKDIVKLETKKELIPIVKDEVIQRALNNNVSGLKWTERMNIHRDTAVLRIRETVAQGLHRGETYSTMSKRLNESLSKQVVNPLRIVRTEGHRVFSEARKDSLDEAKNKVKMTKTWITARDESVRGRNPKDTMDHVSMDGVTIPYEENFKLPDGAEGFAPGQIGDYNDINCRCDWIIDFVDNGVADDKNSENVLDEANENGIITDERISNYKELYDQWNDNNIKSFATKIVDSEGLPLSVEIHQLKQANGQCRLSYSDPKMKILSFELDSKDARELEYQVKTVFHELFHAKSNGLVHDIGNISFDDWAYVDDVFAEVTAHYLTQSVGITKEITSSYPRHLIDTLPRLKKLPEFKDCNSIVDFGRVAYKYRFSDNPNAEWKSLLDTIDSMDHNMIDYSKDYLDYISKNKSGLVDQLLQNIPRFSEYKSDMIEDLSDAIEDMNNGYIISGNQKTIFENALIITMNRLGVR